MALVAVAVLWLAIVVAALTGLISRDAAAFLAAAAGTFAIAAVLAFDAAVDLLDPDERGSLPARLQPEEAWQWLNNAPAWLRIVAIPVFFVAGIVTGHFVWH